MRVLVTGSRDYCRRDRLFEVLNSLPGTTTLLLAGARGVDQLAGDWAKEHKVPGETYASKGPNAGKYPVWDALPWEMLRSGEPDLVVDFEGGNETSEMITAAKKAGVRVILVDP